MSVLGPRAIDQLLRLGEAEPGPEPVLWPDVSYSSGAALSLLGGGSDTGRPELGLSRRWFHGLTFQISQGRTDVSTQHLGGVGVGV